MYDSPYMAMGNSPIMTVDPDGGWSWLGARIRQLGARLSGQSTSALEKINGEWGYYTLTGGHDEGGAYLNNTSHFGPNRQGQALAAMIPG